jgi:hypothetical protein
MRQSSKRVPDSAEKLRSASEAYNDSELASLIVNVNADAVYKKGQMRLEGAHSDIWYEETIHLILSLVRYMRGRDRPNP